ncbi:Ankyrin repeat domain-containing protein 17 [Durusdinium trenchii]|uniref:Ankyrin repeat domain-containing protein 17 n=1 Tax=Durusdinium trenchii TaxID=1381693 RepID=A0ABP0I6E2_9DINO
MCTTLPRCLRAAGPCPRAACPEIRHLENRLGARKTDGVAWLSAGQGVRPASNHQPPSLGIIRENLVIAFQGCGRVRVFVNNEHSLELPETNRLSNTSPFGIDWTKKYRKYLANAHAMRFAEFEIRALPTQVLVIGETATSDQKTIPAQKPILEARTVAKIVVSGHVEKQRHFPSNLGAPGAPIGFSWSGTLGNVSLAEGSGCLPLQSEVKLPAATACMYYQKLNASQKSFLGVDKK